MHPELRDIPESWPVRGVERIWDGNAPFAVRRDTLSAPGEEETFPRVVVEHPGAVVVLALDEQQRALVLTQYRHPIGMRLVELPAGLLDKAGEDPREAAERELREEALLLAEHWTELLSTYSTPGIIEEKITYFLAEGLSEAPDRDGFVPAHEEAHMTTDWVPVDDLLRGVLARELTDGPLAQAVMAYALTRGRPAG
ncbi:MAG: NUDIX domain-containing protein [Nocardioides sp.]